MTCVVRCPRLVDFDQISAWGRWFQENSLYAGCGWSDEKALGLVLAGIDPESKTFMRVVEKDDLLIGFFLGYITEYFFSTKQIAQEMVMVIDPDHRAGIHKPVLRLLKEFISWGQVRGANEICIGITSGIAGPGYEKLLLRSGFRESGSIFKMRC